MFQIEKVRLEQKVFKCFACMFWYVLIIKQPILQCVVQCFLANVNSGSRSLYAVARPPVVCLSSVCLSVCNVRAPYSGGSNFRQYFYSIRYLGHPLISTENFTEIVPGEPLRRGS